MDKTLQFERILALSYKAATYLHFRYGLPIDLGESYALEIWKDNKEQIELLACYEACSISQAEHKVYYLFKDKIRSIRNEDGEIKSGIYQSVDEDNKRVWKSGWMQNVSTGYDTTDEQDFMAMEGFDIPVQKEIFYEHLNDFNLTLVEKAVIDFSFSGYNIYCDIDNLLFREVIGTDSMGYTLTFFNRLCKKLEKESERIGLR